MLPAMRFTGWLVLGSMVLAACGGDGGPVDAGTDARVVRRDSGPPDGGPPPDDSPYKGPWTLQPTTTSILVRWESQLAPASVEIEVEPEAGGTMQSFTGTSRETTVTLSYGVGTTVVRTPDVPGTYHVNEVAVTGLEPATCYRYSLVGWPDDGGRFCTMHAADDHATPISFYVIGDTSPAVMGTLRVLASADPAGTEFTVHVGDLQYYSTLIESQQLWFSLMQPLLEANAFLPCVGNHEMDENGLPEYADIYQRLLSPAGGEADGSNDRWYHFETGGVHFFSLSSEHGLDLGSEQIDWLEERLAAVEVDPSYRFSILYLHRPLYSLGEFTPRDGNREALFPIVDAHRIPLVLAGHVHGYERFEVTTASGRPVTYVTSGAGGFVDSSLDDLVASRPDEAALREFEGLFLQAMVVEIVQEAGEDVIRARTVDDDGMVRDSFEHVVAP